MKRDGFKRHPRIVFREEGEIGLLFDPDTGKINILNETGKFIWSSLDGDKRTSDIVSELAEAFDVAGAEEAKKDIDAFIDLLGGLGFLDNYIAVTQIPLSVCLAITSRCNLNCRHCINRETTLSSEPDLTCAQILEVIDQMAEAGTKNVSLFGGEPLCHPDFRRIVEHINRYDISISLNTNGTLVDPETARWLKAHKITGAVVSFDGSSSEVMERMRGKNTFDRCVSGIRALRAEGLTVLLSVTITKLNYKDVRDMALFGREIGGTSIRFNHVFFGGNAACFLEELYLSPEEETEAIDTVWQAAKEFGNFIYPDSSYLCQKKKLDKVKDHKPSYDKIIVGPCGAAGTKCAIRPDGWVTPCEIMWDVKCGNLKERSLSDIWQNSDLMNSFRKPLEVDLNKIPECRGCGYQYVCFLGHRCYPYYNPGGIGNRGIYCRKTPVEKSRD